jgi:iron complex outermembrane receptor protein
MGRITHKLNGDWEVGIAFAVVDNEVGDPGDNRFAVSNTAIGPYSFSNGVGRNTTTNQMVSAFLSHGQGDNKGRLQVFHSQGSNNLLNDANWGTFDSGYRMSGFKWDEVFVPWQGGKVTTGLEQTAVSGRISGPHVGAAVGTPFAFGTAGATAIPTFRVTSAFAGLGQTVVMANGWVLEPSAGVRLYNSNVYGNKAAPQMGVTLSRDNLTVYAQAARGVLYPGAETYTLTRAIPMAFAANNGWNTLSPSLLTHTELGVQWAVNANAHVDISVFRDKVSDRYTWSGFTPLATGVWSNNFPAYHVSGLETSVRQDLGQGWSGFLGLTLLRPSLSNLPYAPRTAVSVGANGRIGGYRLAVDAQYQTAMFSLTQDRGTFNPNNVPGFTVANARVSKPVPALGRQAEVYLALNNLFNSAYAYNAGYPMPGRTLRVGLIAGF